MTFHIVCGFLGSLALGFVAGGAVALYCLLPALFPPPRRLPSGEPTNVWQRAAYVADRFFEQVEAATETPEPDGPAGGAL